MDETEYHELLELLSDPLEVWIDKQGVDTKLNMAKDQMAYIMVSALFSFMYRCSVDEEQVKKRFLKLKK